LAVGIASAFVGEHLGTIDSKLIWRSALVSVVCYGAIFVVRAAWALVATPVKLDQHLLELAAKNGSADAQYELGSQSQYQSVSGLSATVYWWKLAAGQGCGIAQFALSQLYLYGRGVPQDFVAAAKLLAQDAQQGSFLAQMAIGAMYEKGQGVPQDFVQAHFWFNVAGAKALNEDSRKQATEARDRIAQQMTTEQIAAAQRLARDWKASPNFCQGR